MKTFPARILNIRPTVASYADRNFITLPSVYRGDDTPWSEFSFILFMARSPTSLVVVISICSRSS